VSTLSLFQLVTLIINIFLLLVVVVKFFNAKLGRTFLFIIVPMTIWSLFDFVGSTTTSTAIAFVCERVSEAAATFVGPGLLLFVLTIAYPRALSNIWRRVGLFIPSCIVSGIALTTTLFTTSVTRASWGYDIAHTKEYIFLGIFVASLSALAVIAALSAYHKLNNLQKTQMKFFIAAFLVPLIGGIITEVVAPAFNLQILPMTTALSSITSIIIVYAISRYEFFSITPSLALSQIFNTVHDLLLAIDTTGKIILANAAVSELVGSSSKDLLGKPLAMILRRQNGHPLTSDDVITEQWNDVRMLLVSLTQDKTIPVLVHGSRIVTGGMLQGIVLVIRDMTEIDELVEHLETQTSDLTLSKQKLEKNMNEMKEMNDMMVGRELRMTELKKRIEYLEQVVKEAGIVVQPEVSGSDTIKL
jgi:PAS domain S-box-containing protein